MKAKEQHVKKRPLTFIALLSLENKKNKELRNARSTLNNKEHYEINFSSNFQSKKMKQFPYSHVLNSPSP